MLDALVNALAKNFKCFVQRDQMLWSKGSKGSNCSKALVKDVMTLVKALVNEFKGFGKGLERS